MSNEGVMGLYAREANGQNVSFSNQTVVAGVASPIPLRTIGGVIYRPCVAPWEILPEERAR